MKTKDLIRLLKEADATGEKEVCIDNQPVWFVQCMPAYYDGRLVRYEPPLPIEGGIIVPDKIHFVSEGAKVEIMYYEWKSAVWDSDGEIEVGDCPSDVTRHMVEQEKTRAKEFRDGYEDRQKRLKESRNDNK